MPCEIIRVVTAQNEFLCQETDIAKTPTAKKKTGLNALMSL